jgi:HSP20 family protein
MLSDMMSARRFDPFRQLRAPSDLGRLFGGLTFYPAGEFPPVNLWTSGDGAIVVLAVAGVAPDDLDVTVRRDTVTARGKRPTEAIDDPTVVLRQERSTGDFSRTLVLPFRVDAEKASAKFERGVVTLTLPRPAEDKPRQIKVAKS